MKKLFLFMSWVMLILSGCADEDIIERNSPSFPQSVNTRSAGDGVYDILGYGYDITGPYLDTKSSRAIVFDTNKLLEKGLITPYKLEESRFRYSSGKDVIDFTTNMSSSLQMSTPGILKVIGGASLNIAFGGNSHYNSDYSFAYCTQQYIDSRYRISEADINVLKTCLTKQFIERLSTYTPEQIVEEYGTHVLKDIYLGAKFEVYYMAKSTSSSKKELGFFYDGAGIDICDINKNGTPDLLMMVYDAPEGENSFRYQIAFDLQSNGNYLSLSPVYEVPGLGHDGDGAGVAVGDIDNNGTLDILFMALDAPSGKDKFVYEILPDIDKYGNSYAKPIYTPRFPDSLSPCDTGQGAACCLYDLDNNGFLDAIFVAIENIKGKSNSWKYVTGHNLNKQGVPMCWR